MGGAEAWHIKVLRNDPLRRPERPAMGPLRRPERPAMTLPTPPLLAITDRRQAARPLPETVGALLVVGVRWISLREKDLAAADRLETLAALVALGRPYGAVIMVHGDMAAAAATRAGGVHLPAGGDPARARALLGPGRLVGLSIHTAAEASAAANADYVTASPIFASASKPGYGPALGVDGLAAIVRAASCPVLALGGIGPEQVAACRAAGAAGVAAMGAVMTNPAGATALIAALGG